MLKKKTFVDKLSTKNHLKLLKELQHTFIDIDTYPDLIEKIFPDMKEAEKQKLWVLLVHYDEFFPDLLANIIEDDPNSEID